MRSPRTQSSRGWPTSRLTSTPGPPRTAEGKSAGAARACLDPGHPGPGTRWPRTGQPDPERGVPPGQLLHDPGEISGRLPADQVAAAEHEPSPAADERRTHGQLPPGGDGDIGERPVD